MIRMFSAAWTETSQPRLVAPPHQLVPFTVSAALPSLTRVIIDLFTVHRQTCCPTAGLLSRQDCVMFNTWGCPWLWGRWGQQAGCWETDHLLPGKSCTPAEGTGRPRGAARGAAALCPENLASHYEGGLRTAFPSRQVKAPKPEHLFFCTVQTV